MIIVVKIIRAIMLNSFVTQDSINNDNESKEGKEEVRRYNNFAMFNMSNIQSKHYIFDSGATHHIT